MQPYQAKDQSSSNLIAEMIGGTVGGKGGGLLPDILEPAISSWHRETAHCATTAVAVAGAARTVVLDWEKFWREKGQEFHNRAVAPKMVPNPLQPNMSISAPSDPWTRLLFTFAELFCHFLAGLANGFAAGYVSHIALDTFTPRCVPMFPSFGS
ncbi:MAG: hypothetical protein ACRD3P_06915 [Terriglobales bacterium]